MFYKMIHQFWGEPMIVANQVMIFLYQKNCSGQDANAGDEFKDDVTEGVPALRDLLKKKLIT